MTMKKLWAALSVVLEDHKRAGPNFQFQYRPDNFSIAVPEQLGKNNSVTFKVYETLIEVHCQGQIECFKAAELPRLAAREALNYCQGFCWQNGGVSQAPILEDGCVSVCHKDEKSGIVLDSEGHFWLGWSTPYKQFPNLVAAKQFIGRRLSETNGVSMTIFNHHGKALGAYK
jgi:hypothetical protein